MAANHNYAGIAAWFIKTKAKCSTFEEYLAFLDDDRWAYTVGNNGLYREKQIGSRTPNVRVAQVTGAIDASGALITHKNGAIVRDMRREIDVWLYSTKILTFHPDGTFEAKDGGFNTPTTISRLHQFGPPDWHFGYCRGELKCSYAPMMGRLPRGHRLAEQYFGLPCRQGLRYRVYPRLPVDPLVRRRRIIRHLDREDSDGVRAS